ncbi:Hit family protein 1 [Venturia nashicola]|uniref:Hit family protein 1 n=1 Tax=Venturia nashicola TaxID=86259 RepID=A0A4Z1PAC0_9PEZI|nr:Hit family protein 1 [Venturia nashicola]TLD34751.1 Hit family protein 1 [Venturia nashicola]
MPNADYNIPSAESCPFCTIANAYPSAATTSAPSTTQTVKQLQSAVPMRSEITKVSPSCFLVLSAPSVMAFLDILPMTRGHLLVTVRGHREKVHDMGGGEAGEVGFWLPVLAKVVSKVTGTTDYNLVQNNGVRAAQVVPHVHFHVIPRPGNVPELKNKSWTMFGRGQREELDDDEGEKLAGELRDELRQELERYAGQASKL